MDADGAGDDSTVVVDGIDGVLRVHWLGVLVWIIICMLMKRVLMEAAAGGKPGTGVAWMVLWILQVQVWMVQVWMLHFHSWPC